MTVDLKALLARTDSDEAVIWMEQSDGKRHRMTDASKTLPLDKAKEQLTFFANSWKREGAGRAIHIDDAVTISLMVKISRPKRAGNVLVKEPPDYARIALLYIEPLPQRDKHPGDFRIDRDTQKRRPIR